MPLISYSGPSSAAVFTAGVINAKWDKAVELIDENKRRMDVADLIADSAPQLEATALDTSYLPALKPDIPFDDPNAAIALYDSAKAEMEALVQDGFAKFLGENFPDGTYYQSAQDWLERAITEGGTGISADVEQQLWERGRARVAGESQRAEAEVTTMWARRGFELPPGPLVHQVGLIKQDGRNKLAEQSRDIAAKSFDAELENARFAVKTLLDLRTQAIAAAGDYIKTLMLGPQTAMQLATSTAGLKTEYARTLVAMYSAENQALEPRVRLAVADGQLREQAAEANLRAKSQAQSDRLQAAISSASQTATLLASMMNAINAGTSFSGSEAV